uniref:Variant surface glycoprotein 1125.1346 n=1 Tax=Trypanosoma brucei TaxID=5691 RepID=A0A1J0R4J7_9TRYP|nr:variant surface glycoprotein 1125.1346 [Trypanosoma brucei]
MEISRKYVLTCLLFAAAVTNFSGTDEAASNTINNRCSEIIYLVAVSKYIAKQAKTGRQLIHKLQTYATAWKLAAVQTPDSQLKAGYTTLSAYAMIQHKKHAATLRRRQETAERAQQILSERIGYTEALYRQPTLATGNAAYAAGDNGYAAKCTFTLTQSGTTRETCDLEKAKDTGVDSTAFSWATATKIKLLNLATTPPRLPQVAAQGKGVQGNVDKATGGARCDQSGDEGTNALKVTLGAIAPDTGLTGEQTRLYASDDMAKGCATVEQPDTKTASDNWKVAHAICEFLATPTPTATDPDNWNPETLAQQQDFSALSTNYLIATGQYTKEAASQNAENTKTALKKLLGMNKDGYKTRYVAPLKDRNVKYQDGTTEGEASLLKVEDGAAPKVFVYLQG